MRVPQKLLFLFPIFFCFNLNNGLASTDTVSPEAADTKIWLDEEVQQIMREVARMSYRSMDKLDPTFTKLEKEETVDFIQETARKSVSLETAYPELAIFICGGLWRVADDVFRYSARRWQKDFPESGIENALFLTAYKAIDECGLSVVTDGENGFDKSLDFYRDKLAGTVYLRGYAKAWEQLDKDFIRFSTSNYDHVPWVRIMPASAAIWLKMPTLMNESDLKAVLPIVRSTVEMLDEVTPDSGLAYWELAPIFTIIREAYANIVNKMSETRSFSELEIEHVLFGVENNFELGAYLGYDFKAELMKRIDGYPYQWLLKKINRPSESLSFFSKYDERPLLAILEASDIKDDFHKTSCDQSNSLLYVGEDIVDILSRLDKPTPEQLSYGQNYLKALVLVAENSNGVMNEAPAAIYKESCLFESYWTQWRKDSWKAAKNLYRKAKKISELYLSSQPELSLRLSTQVRRIGELN